MTQSFLPAALMLARLMIGLTFLVSAAGKLRRWGDFEGTVKEFDVLPYSLHRIVALLVLIGEIAVVGLLASGGAGLIIGFGLAVALLVSFTCVVCLALRRAIAVACNCFGPGKAAVSRATVWRNVAFLVCAVAGLCLSILMPQGELGLAEMMLLGAAAGICVLILTHIEDLAYLFAV